MAELTGRYNRAGFITAVLGGGPEILRRLNAIDAAAERKIVRQSLRNGARIVAKRAKELAPKRSGRLAKLIRVRAMRRKRGRIGYSVLLTSRDMGEDFYGGFVELGTKHFDGRAFLRDAFKQTLDVVEGVVRTGLWNGIRAAAEKKA